MIYWIDRTPYLHNLLLAICAVIIAVLGMLALHYWQENEYLTILNAEVLAEQRYQKIRSGPHLIEMAERVCHLNCCATADG